MAEEVEHGIELACYSNGPYGFQPRMECTCGFSTSRSCDNWAEAGSEFDAHIYEALAGSPSAGEPPR